MVVHGQDAALPLDNGQGSTHRDHFTLGAAEEAQTHVNGVAEAVCDIFINLELRERLMQDHVGDLTDCTLSVEDVNRYGLILETCGALNIRASLSAIYASLIEMKLSFIFLLFSGSTII